MLAGLGYDSLDALTDAAIPEALRTTSPLELPGPRNEAEVSATLRELAARNNPGRSLIGQGYAGTLTPAVIRAGVLGDPGWYTAYTPYQPEISQGRLEALLVFQTMISDLTGLPVAGAGLLDEASAVAEAVAMARRSVKDVTRARVLVDAGLYPASLAVLRTRAGRLGVEVVVTDLARADVLDGCFAVLVQTPTRDGRLAATTELAGIAERAHAAGALVIAAADPLALTLVVPPGEWGADIAIGSTQRFGVPLFYGGPHAAYLACRDALVRQLPGRIVGVSVDADGVPALRLALQAREQHIRREKATSNICTAQSLVAVMAAMYAVWHGPEGLRAIASGIHERACALAGALRAAGFVLRHESFFDTVWVEAPGRATALWDAAHAAGLHVFLDRDAIGVSLGEDVTDADLAALRSAFGAGPSGEPWGTMAAMPRTSPYLTHPVFGAYRSETAMRRYLRTLSRRDFALDQGMIPLGSCTMKLTAAIELEALGLPGFAGLHPFVPPEDAAGYAELIGTLERWLCVVTGYEAVSFQPNAGSQGELAGLLAIRAYHEHRGEAGRDVCLIPASAHGTNAASAACAGLQVVVVKTAPDGTVDLDDLAARCDEYGPRVAAVMVTYPSTHGVFEETLPRVVALAHGVGAQVYVDGANLNALAGLVKPGEAGADVSHLNLHKTFAMPHGGGGPGVGPVAVAAHLVPFLPTDARGGDGGIMVAGSPYGSAGLLPISYAYVALMGADGVRRASQVAVLNANHIAARLHEAFPVLYTGRGGLVAHECILDVASVVAPVHLSVDDIAKRLIDYGFHAPTMSFPVAGTLMVEPTESEDKGELDRFCDAMLAIRAEIDQVAGGTWSADDNPLVNAPHPLSRVTAEEWTHPYPRALAAPGASTGLVAGRGPDKYWPPVARIDNTYGDRHLVVRLA